jgi:hypothetical protein
MVRIDAGGEVERVVSYVHSYVDGGYLCVPQAKKSSFREFWQRVLKTCKAPKCLNKAVEGGYCASCTPSLD